LSQADFFGKTLANFIRLTGKSELQIAIEYISLVHDFQKMSEIFQPSFSLSGVSTFFKPTDSSIIAIVHLLFLFQLECLNRSYELIPDPSIFVKPIFDLLSSLNSISPFFKTLLDQAKDPEYADHLSYIAPYIHSLQAALMLSSFSSFPLEKMDPEEAARQYHYMKDHRKMAAENSSHDLFKSTQENMLMLLKNAYQNPIRYYGDSQKYQSSLGDEETLERREAKARAAQYRGLFENFTSVRATRPHKELTVPEKEALQEIAHQRSRYQETIKQANGECLMLFLPTLKDESLFSVDESRYLKAELLQQGASPIVEAPSASV